MDADQRKRFLEAVANGAPITVASQLAEIPRRTVYNWKRAANDNAREFRRDWIRADVRARLAKG